ncbi:MAG: fructosamine kinase family protein [Gemmatimonadetes bacterium]|nr:fructosamine kinase family protein [Gemmatimonadota bacterium]
MGGGCINHGARVETADGPVFLKYNPQSPAGMLAAEAYALDQLREQAADLIVPRVIANGEADGDAPAWLALEWLEPAPRSPEFLQRLGRGLAQMHRAAVDGSWGWDQDNFIGSLAQQNAPTDTWSEFWRDRRLGPQLDLARRTGRLPGREADWERLFDRLPAILRPADEDGPSLLHGDLWSGNVLAATAGPALIDPATYRGHREADLAMADLFGGFGDRFHAAYREVWPLQPGYEARRPVYQLYYLLVHVNLFGGGYVGQTAETLRTILQASS